MDGASAMEVDATPGTEAVTQGALLLDALPDGAALVLMRLLPVDMRARLACCSRRWRRVSETPALWQRVALAGAHARCVHRLPAILHHARQRAGVVQGVDLRGVACTETVYLSTSRNHVLVGDGLSHDLCQHGRAAHLTFLHTGDVAAMTPSAVTALAAARSGTAPLETGSFITVAFNAERPRRPLPALAGVPPPPPAPPPLVVPPGCDVALRPLDQVLVHFHPHGAAHGEQRLNLVGALRAVAASQACVTALSSYVKVGQPVTRHWAELLVVAQEAPAVFARLQHLDLRSEGIAPADFGPVTQLLASPACSLVEVLQLSGCHIATPLLAAAGTLPSLTELDVSHIPMNEERATALGTALAMQAGRNEPLKLDVSHCELRDAGLARSLGTALGAGCSFTTLVLSSNFLTDASVIALCDALTTPRAPCPLTRLVLGSNAIRAGGASALAGALAAGHLPQLRYLDLSDTLLREEGGAVLAACLSSPHCRLHFLEVSFCRLGDDGLRCFAEVLHSNSQLRNLHVADAGATDVGVFALAAGLEAATRVGNTALKVLHVGSVRAQCSDAALERLQAAGHRLKTCSVHRPKVPPPPPSPVSDDAEAGPSRPEL